MCTALALHGEQFLFGRNMDLDWDFDGEIVIAPRKARLSFPESQKRHYAIIGMAKILENYPLYADAANERGLCMAALNFPESAYYFSSTPYGFRGVASFELIPFILSTCATVEETLPILKTLCITDRPFRKDVSATPLHWIIADQHQTLTIEPTANGLQVYHNPLDVLTNEPPFQFHLENQKYHQGFSAKPIESRSESANSPTAIGAMGLPGDYSSVSRFLKAEFLLRCSKMNTKSNGVGHLFRLLQAVAPPKGSVILPNGNSHYTVYSGCMEPLKGFYHYQRYGNLSTVSKNLFSYPLDGESLISTM